MLAFAASASAKTIKVNTTKDVQPTGGECASHSSCSLRQAVDAAAPGDTISVPSSKHKHYVLTHGPVEFAKSLTIRGAGAKSTVIDGNGGNGIFIEFGSPGGLTIEGVTITGSQADSSFNGQDLGAVVDIGLGAVHLSDCVIEGNSATEPSFSSVVSGGLDVESGAVTISHCSITANHMSGSSDGSVGAGGVISEGGPLRISGSDISGNSATMKGVGAIIGGGVVSEGGAVTISNSTVANNKATATDTSQQSDGAGGVLSDGGPSTLKNVTIASNKDKGNGDFNAGGFNNDGGTGTFVYVTAARNSGGAAANLVSSGSVWKPFGSIFALAPHGQKDCLLNGTTTASSQGYNFADAKSCGLNGPHDRTHGNPKLGKLADHGGPGETVALLKGSPLIDFIPRARCPSSIKTDERGRPRPDKGEPACDVGAYEFQDK